MAGGGGAGAAGGGGTVGTGLKKLGQACAERIDCESKFCASGVCCASPCDGACVSCALPGSVGVCAGLGAGTVCGPGRCDGDAIVGVSICDGQGTCASAPTVVCAPYACDAATASCKATCTSDADCFNRSCVNGSCGVIPIGAKCSLGAECASGFCSDGQCCNLACQGACVSCSLPGRAGTCWPVDVGAPDPRAICKDQGVATCGTKGTCDGFGGCQLYSSGTRCSDSACVGNLFMSPRTCDGKGVCTPGPSLSCAPFVCDQANARCFTTCVTSAQCLNADCQGNTCGPRRDTPCSAGAECASGFCAQGVCCDSPCSGSCVSCALPGSVGHCAPVAAGALDPKGICQDQGAASCGTNGRCDGLGGCATYPLGTTCSAPSCSGATLAMAGQCNALQACIVRFAACAPYTCRDDAPMCHSDCTAGDSVCDAGFYCGGDEVCVPKKPGGAPCQSNHECQSNLCPPAPTGAVSVCMSLI